MRIEPIELGSRNAWLRRANRRLPLTLPKQRRRIQWGPALGLALCFLPLWIYLGWHVWRWMGR